MLHGDTIMRTLGPQVCMIPNSSPHACVFFALHCRRGRDRPWYHRRSLSFFHGGSTCVHRTPLADCASHLQTRHVSEESRRCASLVFACSQGGAQPDRVAALGFRVSPHRGRCIIRAVGPPAPCTAALRIPPSSSRARVVCAGASTFGSFLGFQAIRPVTMSS